MVFTPYQHQIDAQNIMKNMENEGNGGLIADSMGLGKTATMAMFLKANKYQDKTDLIVCPFSVLQNWVKEIKNVKDYPTVSDEPSILLYHGSKRVSNLASKKWDYVITTYSIIGTGELNKKRWGRVVLDESHTIKNGLRSKKPRCAVASFEIGKMSLKNWCISGTPFNNRVKDIGAQCCFLGTAPYNDPNWWKKPSDEDIEEWRSKFVLQRTKENLLIPPRYHDISVIPFVEETEIVNAMRAKAQANFKKWKQSSGYRRIQLQARVLTLITKLRIISNSFYCGETEFDANEVMANSSKVARMINDFKEQMEEEPKKGLVVFSQFQMFLDVLAQVINVEMPEVEVLKFNGSLNGTQRDNVISYFNESRSPRILLISMGAGGVGLSLHYGSSTIFISEPNYNPFLEQQAEERVHRLGQERQVQVFRYTMNNSVETWINGMKSTKMAKASTLGLIKTEKPIKSYSFNDLSNLFADFVAFTTPEGKPIRKKVSKIKVISENENENESKKSKTKKHSKKKSEKENKKRKKLK